jgi:hypothetical protein
MSLPGLFSDWPPSPIGQVNLTCTTHQRSGEANRYTKDHHQRHITQEPTNASVNLRSVSAHSVRIPEVVFGAAYSFSDVRGSAPCVEPLSSWVLDWSQCYPYARPFCAPDFKSRFNACNALFDVESRRAREQACPHIWKDALPTDQYVLVVRGRAIGIISWFSPPDFEGTC